MLKDYMGMLMLNESEVDIRSLTVSRPLAAIPIGGRYRIIDFILSNMVNVGINNVGIFTKSNSRALTDHLGKGKAWGLDRNTDGLFVFNFYTSSSNYSNDYDAKMIRNNMEYLYRSKQNHVILAPAYMICNIDFKEVIKDYEESKSDIMVVYKNIDNANKDMINCDVLNIDANRKVLSIGKNIGIDKNANISMEMFIMKKETLINFIYKFIRTGYHETLKESIYRHINEINIVAHEFKGYLRCINSIKNYYCGNMDMLNPKVIQELFLDNRHIYTKIKNEPPTKYLKGSKVSNSLISNGCIIDGKVENSIISRKVIVHKDAVVKNSIILQNCEICKGANLDNVIIDKNVIIQNDCELKGNCDFPLVIEKRNLTCNYEKL